MLCQQMWETRKIALMWCAQRASVITHRLSVHPLLRLLTERAPGWTVELTLSFSCAKFAYSVN